MEVGTTSPLANARLRFVSSDSDSVSDSDDLLLFSEEEFDFDEEEAVDDAESFLHTRDGHVPVEKRAHRYKSGMNK